MIERLEVQNKKKDYALKVAYKHSHCLNTAHRTVISPADFASKAVAKVIKLCWNITSCRTN